jgi:hypothetical protein
MAKARQDFKNTKYSLLKILSTIPWMNSGMVVSAKVVAVVSVCHQPIKLLPCSHEQIRLLENELNQE